MANPQWLTDMGNLGDDIVLGLDGSARPHEIRYMPHVASAPLIAAGTDVSLEGQNLSNMTFPSPLPVPTNITPPVLTVREAPNLPVVGAQMISTGGTWAHTDISARWEFQWFSNGTPRGVPEPNGLYTPGANDEGNFITVSVRTDNATGWSPFVSSNYVGPVEAAP
jgi:hypothetical protein